MTENLALWRAVEKTDPKHVKGITGKSYQGNSPKPHYLVHKATETFGPCGIGWGFTIEDERIEEGAGGERMSLARVRVWYKWNGERGEVEHIGGTQFSGVRASGKPFTDEDAPKKSVTDALVKALSMIGFAGDIFMGRYDDSKYVSEVREEFSEGPPRKENGLPETGWREDGTRTSFALKKEQPELMADLDRELDECKTLVSLEKLKTAYRTKAATEKWNKSFMNTMKEVFDRREKAIMDEMERLSDAPDEELAALPAREAFEHSVNTLRAG
jgi:hypothetical protein